MTDHELLIAFVGLVSGGTATWMMNLVTLHMETRRNRIASASVIAALIQAAQAQENNNKNQGDKNA